MAGAYGRRQALEAGTRGWGRVAYGGEWGRVAYGGEHTTEGTYQGTSLHAQGTPCMCLICTVEPVLCVRIVIVGSCVRGGVATPLQIEVLSC